MSSMQLLLLSLLGVTVAGAGLTPTQAPAATTTPAQPTPGAAAAACHADCIPVGATYSLLATGIATGGGSNHTNISRTVTADTLCFDYADSYSAYGEEDFFCHTHDVVGFVACSNNSWCRDHGSVPPEGPEGPEDSTSYNEWSNCMKAECKAEQFHCLNDQECGVGFYGGFNNSYPVVQQLFGCLCTLCNHTDTMDEGICGLNCDDDEVPPCSSTGELIELRNRNPIVDTADSGELSGEAISGIAIGAIAFAGFAAMAMASVCQRTSASKHGGNRLSLRKEAPQEHPPLPSPSTRSDSKQQKQQRQQRAPTRGEEEIGNSLQVV